MVQLDDARQQLSELHPILVDAHVAAVAAWASLVTDRPDLAIPLNSTTRANFVHNHIEAEVARRVADLPGVAIADGLDFFGLWLDGILLRFKFVGHGEPSNYPTTQQKLLARQIYTEDMVENLTGDPALDPPTLLTCGYTLDGDKVGRMEIRRDCVGHLPWSYDIYGGEAVNQPIALKGMEDTAKPAKIKSTKTKQDEDAARETEAG